MKALTALLCLSPVLCLGATKLQICTTAPTATGANQLLGCPKTNVTWGPVRATDLVRAITAKGQGWVAFNTLTANTQVVPQSTGSWALFGSLTVTPPAIIPDIPVAPPVIPPVTPIATHLYQLTWEGVTTRVDGTALTDLTGYGAVNGPSVTGPWSNPQTVTGTTVSYLLPSGVQQCFQVRTQTRDSGVSDPATLCMPPIASTALPNSPVHPKVQ